jgi:hypothetical protein
VLIIRLGSVASQARLKVRRENTVRKRGLMRMGAVVRQGCFWKEMGACKKVRRGLLREYASA